MDLSIITFILKFLTDFGGKLTFKLYLLFLFAITTLNWFLFDIPSHSEKFPAKVTHFWPSFFDQLWLCLRACGSVCVWVSGMMGVPFRRVYVCLCA